MAKVAVRKNAVNESKALLTDVKSYAHRVWLAGLGAYVKAGQEGTDYFRELVKTGERVEKQSKRLVDSRVEAANGQLREQVRSIRSGVGERLEKIEKAFDDRVAAGLNRLGIPSRQDVEALSAKLDELNELLERAARTH
ncbi:phasin family protein [Pseudomonas sp. LRF_L74]|uniref:phasin family protein n=1 Tax=Pseudomonas sp. LRF_L74 TaxID=3369422 RepID=UPI003F5DD3F5